MCQNKLNRWDYLHGWEQTEYLSYFLSIRISWKFKIVFMDENKLNLLDHLDGSKQVEYFR